MPDLNIQDLKLWHSPTEFRDAANSLIGIDPDDLFNDPSNQFRMDAYIAAQFATAYCQHEPCRVRLTEDELYDFELKASCRVMGFQAVEADREGRRRGDEYQRRVELDPPHAVHVDLEEEFEHARQAIKRVLTKKAAKHYAPKPNVVVLVNLWFEDTPEQCVQLTQQWASAFESIWLLKPKKPNTRVLRIWPSVINLSWSPG